ncbi:MFS transporter [Clostridium oceanicum]|uniref:MFS transporter n=1 Tax=Clostridium oceanicum TaxID=1543 RepID=A0ABP3UQS6_9CLOT
MEYKNKDYIYKNRWKILNIVLLAPFMATLDSSIVNVALPFMADKLSVGISTIQWVVTSYLIIISSTILAFGRLADIIGKTKVFQYGFLIFSLGSLFCGISYTIYFLIFSRIIQAIGASMIMACNQGIIADIFPKEERGRALGFSGTTVAVGTMVGPPIGGIILGILDWEYIFLINVPIGIIAYIIGIKILPKYNQSEIHNKVKEFDIKGFILFFIASIALFGAMLSGEKVGWNNRYIIFSFFIFLVFLILFYFNENKVRNPILNFNLFYNRLFSVSLICAFISYMVIFSTNIIQPFYLQYGLKMSPKKAGIFLMIYPMTVSIIAPISGYISDKVGSEVITLLGLVVTFVGLYSLSTLNLNSSYYEVIFKTSILGIGNGFFQAPNNSIVMSAVPKNRLGIAGSINALVRNIGMVFGIALSIVLLNNRMSYKIGYKVDKIIKGKEYVFIYGMRFVYIVCAILCFVGIMLTLWRIKSKRGKFYIKEK